MKSSKRVFSKTKLQNTKAYRFEDTSVKPMLMGNLFRAVVTLGSIFGTQNDIKKTLKFTVSL